MGARDAAQSLLAWLSMPAQSWLILFVPALISFFMSLSNFSGHFELVGGATVGLSSAKLVAAGEAVAVLDRELGAAKAATWVTGSDRSFLLFSDPERRRVYRWEQGLGALTVGRSLYLEGVNVVAMASSNGGDTLLLSDAAVGGIKRLDSNGSASTFHLAQGDTQLPAPSDMVLAPEGHIILAVPEGVFRLDAWHVSGTAEEKREVQNLGLAVAGATSVAYSPDAYKLYVLASGGEARAGIWAFSVHRNGTVDGGSGQELVRGLPAGGQVRTDAKGNLWVAGTGGLRVFSKGGEPLGRVSTLGNDTSSAAFGDDGYLYMTDASALCRLKTASGAPPELKERAAS